MIGILALEAHRAGAVVVGEDLGTVEPWVRDYLRERGILGTSILWFEFDWDGDGAPLAPEKWREYCLASVTTHDLPPTAGYLAGDHVRLRDQLGILTRSLDEELAADEAERQAWLDDLRSSGRCSRRRGEEETVAALHRYLTWTPSRLLCVALADAVGDRQVQNQPGTIDEYPNWRVPLTGPDWQPVDVGGRLQQPADSGACQDHEQRPSSCGSPGTAVGHALLDRLADHIRLFLGQNAGLDRLVQIPVHRSRPQRLLATRISSRAALISASSTPNISDRTLISAASWSAPGRDCLASPVAQPPAGDRWVWGSGGDGVQLGGAIVGDTAGGAVSVWRGVCGCGGRHTDSRAKREHSRGYCDCGLRRSGHVLAPCRRFADGRRNEWDSWQ